MPTSGLVITLSSDASPASVAVQATHQAPDLTVGDLVGGRFLPATLHADQSATTATIALLEALPEIEQVAITWIGLDDPISSPPTPAATPEPPSHLGEAAVPAPATKGCQP